MSKNKEEVFDGSPVDEAPKSSPIDELRKNGTITLTANSRDELFEKFNELKASSEGATLSTGCVGQKEDGTFALQVDINK